MGREGETHLNLTHHKQKDLLRSPPSSEQPAQLVGDLREYQDKRMDQATNSLADLKLKRMQVLSGKLEMVSYSQNLSNQNAVTLPWTMKSYPVITFSAWNFFYMI